MSLSMTAKHCKHPRKHRSLFMMACYKCGRLIKPKDLARSTKR